MSGHLKPICSAIDQLPETIDFSVSQYPKDLAIESSEASGLFQELGDLGTESPDAGSSLSQKERDLAPIDPEMLTSDTSFSQPRDQAGSKKPKRKHSTR